MNSSPKSSEITRAEKFPLEHICAWCKDYCFKDRSEAGQAYCKRWEKWFEGQMDVNKVSAGMRTCQFWEQK